MMTSGEPPGPDATVTSTGPFGALPCASAGPETNARARHAIAEVVTTANNEPRKESGKIFAVFIFSSLCKFFLRVEGR